MFPLYLICSRFFVHLFWFFSHECSWILCMLNVPPPSHLLSRSCNFFLVLPSVDEHISFLFIGLPILTHPYSPGIYHTGAKWVILVKCCWVQFASIVPGGFLALSIHQQCWPTVPYTVPLMGLGPKGVVCEWVEDRVLQVARCCVSSCQLHSIALGKMRFCQASYLYQRQKQQWLNL